ncbi:MAG: flap endonuclease [Opitutae bacterium]|nr:flap endonuclease [Opitutae bacterium]
MAKTLLIDGHNFAYRAFYGISELSRSDGFPTNAIHGWLRACWRLEDEEKPDSIIVFFDCGGDDKREELLPEYKANRSKCPDELALQFPWMKKLVVACGYGLDERPGIEADDLIGAAATALVKRGDEALIASSDKDLAQCVRPGVIQVLPPPTANPRLGWRRLDEVGVEAKFGVRPDQVADFLALVGDSSDNIPGLAGVGPKTATKWLQSYGDLEGVIDNAGRLVPKRFCSIVYEGREKLRRNLELTTLREDLEVSIDAPASPNLAELRSILEEMEMNKSLEEALRRYGS